MHLHEYKQLLRTPEKVPYLQVELLKILLKRIDHKYIAKYWADYKIMELIQNKDAEALKKAVQDMFEMSNKLSKHHGFYKDAAIYADGVYWLMFSDKETRYIRAFECATYKYKKKDRLNLIKKLLK